MTGKKRSAMAVAERQVIGNNPAAIKAARVATACASLMFRTAMVARPIAVRPTNTGPFQRKCRLHLWWRG